ncbi:MAG: hypothetical protein WKF91_09500 [Segetibacter sp.]
MKMKTHNIILTCLFGIAIFAACKKVPLSNTETFLPSDKAFIRIALYSPGTPAVMIKADSVKINGNNTSGNGGLFPSTSNFPDYASVPAGSTLKLSLANTGTQNDSIVLFNGKLDLESGKFYSVTLADTGIKRTAFSIEDKFVMQKDSFLNVRLINAMVGSTLTLLRIDSATATDVVRDTLARNIPYKGTSGFIPVNTNTFTTRPIRIRIVSTINGRSYGTPQISPQTFASSSRRSITFYAFGFEDGLVPPFLPGLSANITNQ